MLCHFLVIFLFLFSLNLLEIGPWVSACVCLYLVGILCYTYYTHSYSISFFLFWPNILSNKMDCRFWFIEMIFRFLNTEFGIAHHYHTHTHTWFMCVVHRLGTHITYEPSPRIPRSAFKRAPWVQAFRIWFILSILYEPWGVKIRTVFICYFNKTFQKITTLRISLFRFICRTVSFAHDSYINGEKWGSMCVREIEAMA